MARTPGIFWTEFDVRCDRRDPLLSDGMIISVTAHQVTVEEFQADHARELIPMWRESFELGVGIGDPHPIAAFIAGALARACSNGPIASPAAPCGFSRLNEMQAHVRSTSATDSGSWLADSSRRGS